MTNTKGKPEKEARVQIKTRQPGPVSPSGFSQLRRHADLDSVDTVAEILSLPTESPTPAEGSTRAAGSTHVAGITYDTGDTLSEGLTRAESNTQLTGSTQLEGTTYETANTHSAGHTSETGQTRRVGITKRARNTRTPTNPGAAAPISPERDFQKVPNSVTREMASRLFRGKSKQLYDYLWSQSRGAISPTRTVRRSRPQLLRGAGFGSMGTVERCVDFLVEVGLLKVRTIVGESEGNEYEIFTPEEAAPALLGLPSALGNTSTTGNTGSTPIQVLPVSPETGNTGSTSSSTPSSVSGEPKTSFKTLETDDDEAFAGLVARLKQTVKEVTGREVSPAEAERWNELGDLLADELKSAAARTTVSSVPAFLAEHLRRRLGRSYPAEPARHAPPQVEPRTAPQPPTDDELVRTFTDMLHSGFSLEDLDGQLSRSVESERWPEIRAAVLELYERERGQVQRTGDAPLDGV